ncbi:MAG TPA: hypothetical protein VN700_15205 [Vicinamibacterales bacterium]|nr:hypothetical protein [Vicinamibacterales bacterium]
MRTTLIAIVLLASGFAQQARPNFSGEWVLAKDRSSQQMNGAVVVSVTGLLGEKFTATQDSKTLVLDISLSGLPKPIRAVYNLDGSESRNINPPDEPIFSKVSWDDRKLVIKTRGSALVNGKPTESTRVIWIDGDGSFTIERSSEGQPTTRSVYTRAR